MVTHITIDFLSTAAGSTDEFYACVAAPGDWQIIGAYFAPSTAAAANGTNYATLTLATNDGAGGAYSAIGNITTETVAMAVANSRAITVSGAGCYVSQGDMIRAAKTEAASGAVLHGTVVLALRKVN